MMSLQITSDYLRLLPITSDFCPNTIHINIVVVDKLEHTGFNISFQTVC